MKNNSSKILCKRGFTQCCHAELVSASTPYKAEIQNKDAFRTPLRSGFTLIELLVVVLIIGVLAAIALPRYQFAVYKSKIATGFPVLKAIKEAQDVYYLANGMWATSFDDLDVSLPAGCVPQSGDMRCGDVIYGFQSANHGGVEPTRQVWFEVKGCPAAKNYSCGRIYFPYNGSYFGWYYQHVDGPYCKATCNPGGYPDSCLTYAHRICKSFSGEEPVANIEYPL